MRIKKLFIIIFASFLVLPPVFGKEKSITPVGKYWSKTFGGKGRYSLEDVINVEDGFVITGYVKFTDSDNNDDLFVARVDSGGKMAWNKRFGGLKYERGYSVNKLFNGFIVAGMIDSGGKTGRDAWILKFDESGDIIWNKVIGGHKDDFAAAVKPDLNNYIAVGSTASYGKAKQSIWIIQLDGTGEVIWDKTYGDGSFNIGVDIIVEKDGYVVAGNTVTEKNNDVLFFKIDRKGKIIWDRILGSNRYNYVESIKGGKDGYILAGTASRSEEGEKDAWVLKLDLKGNLEWSKTYGGKGDDSANSISATNEGYIISGSTNSYSDNGSFFGWLFEIDKTGKVLWNKYYDEVYGVKKAILIYDGYLIVGNKIVRGGDRNIWLLRADKKGEIINEK